MTVRTGALSATNSCNGVGAGTEVRARFGRLDILVNNGGIGLSSAVTEISLGDWRRQMAVNVDGPFLGVKHGLPLMREGGGGGGINVSSIAGIKASPNVPGYARRRARCDSSPSRSRCVFEESIGTTIGLVGVPPLPHLP